MKKEFPVALADEVCFFMIEGMGLIAGKLNFNGTIIKKPRAVQVQQGVQGQQAQMRYGELLGSPEEMFLERKPIMAYKVMDRDMVNLYIQTTTGLVMPGAAPGPTPSSLIQGGNV